LSTKIHQICDGNRRPVVLMIGPGQGGDSPVLRELLGVLAVGRAGPGRPRTRPEAVLADKAYSCRANRAHLRRRGITATIPEPTDQQGHRKRRGRRGGRPVSYDPELYKRRNTIERAFNAFKNWRGIATRYDKLAQTFRAGIMLATAYTWLRTLGDTP
jgi:transposase